MFASIHAWWTVLLFMTFVGIVVWAFQSARKSDFDEASRLPLDDDEVSSASSNDKVTDRATGQATGQAISKDGNAHG